MFRNYPKNRWYQARSKYIGEKFTVLATNHGSQQQQWSKSCQTPPKLPVAGDAQEISAETAIRPDEGIGVSLSYFFSDVVEVWFEATCWFHTMFAHLGVGFNDVLTFIPTEGNDPILIFSKGGSSKIFLHVRSFFLMFSLHPRKLTTMPIQSMHGIFTYIYHKDQPNVGKYTSPMDPSWDGKQKQPFEDVTAFPSSKKLGDFPVMESCILEDVPFCYCMANQPTITVTTPPPPTSWLLNLPTSWGASNLMCQIYGNFDFEFPWIISALLQCLGW